MLKFILSLLAVSLTLPNVQAQILQWNQTAASTTYDWNVAANWLPSTVFPDAVGGVANVNNDIVGNQTIRLQEDITIGTLNLGDATGTSTFTIANEGVETFILTLDNGASHARISKTTGGNDIISALVNFADPTSLNITTNSLTFSNAVSGAVPITKTGTGTATITGSINDATSVAAVAGTLTIGSASSSAFNNARFGDSAGLDLASGLVQFQGVSDAATTENIGAVTVRAGSSDLRLLRGSTVGSILVTGDSLTRDSSRGVLALNQSTQSGLGAAGADSFARIMFDTAPTAQLVGNSGTDGTTNISILPYALGPNYEPTASSDGSFVTYSAATGLRSLTTAEYVTTINGSSDAAGRRDNIGLAPTTNPPGGSFTEVVTTGTEMAGTRSVNSIIVRNQIATGGGTLTVDLATNGITLGVNSGAIATSGGANLTFNGGTVAFGSREAILSAGGSRNFTMNSQVTGSGGLTKGAGGGNLLLSNANNNFTGGVVINEGTLIVQTNNEVIPDSNSVTIRGGATFSIQSSRTETVASLAGNGRTLFSGSSVANASRLVVGTGASASNTVVVSSSLSPGDVLPGRMTIDTVSTLAGGLSLLSGAQINIDLNSADLFNYDSIGVNNTIALGSGFATLNLTDSGSVTLGLGTYFTILENTNGATSTIGFFIGRAGGSVFTLGANSYRIDYNGIAASGALIGGNDVLLTVVPEPSTFAMLLVGFGMLMGFQRTRRRS